MPTYRILIGPRNAPRLSFEVSAPSAFHAHEQHVELARFGERFDVQPVVANQPAADDQVAQFRRAGAI